MGSDAPGDFDLIAAALRADTSDVGAFVESLAAKLEQTIPLHVTVERRRDGMFGPKLVRRIAVDGADQRLELLRDGGVVKTRAARVSGGIVLKNELLDTDQWLAALGETLAAEAKRSETTRQALERLLVR
jgi:hypothetical protein